MPFAHSGANNCLQQELTLLFTLAAACIAETVRDATTIHIIGGHFELDAIAQQDADLVLSHLTRQIGENSVTIIQFYQKLRIRQRLYDCTL
jgi:hypothetical protein